MRVTIPLQHEILTVTRAARDLEFDKIRLTGGEPTVRPDLLGIIRGLSGLGFRAILMTTNGPRLCRLRDDEGDLRPLLRGGASYEALKQRMGEFIYRKPWGHGLPENVIPLRRVMSQVGG